MCLDLIAMWHDRARPNPDSKALGVSLGVHAEEFVEMLESLEPTEAILNARQAVGALAELWKEGIHYPMIADRNGMLDSLADQIVTAMGVGHCANMRTTEACRRVNHSNWSKFDRDGKPIFKPNGKVDKGPDYARPDLSGLY